jgi:hypothetical protein
MRNEGAVDGEEPQSLDLTLREQHPVERIAGHRLGLDGRERVAFVDRDNPDAEAVEKLGRSSRATPSPLAGEGGRRSRPDEGFAPEGAPQLGA